MEKIEIENIFDFYQILFGMSLTNKNQKWMECHADDMRIGIVHVLTGFWDESERTLGILFGKFMKEYDNGKKFFIQDKEEIKEIVITRKRKEKI